MGGQAQTIEHEHKVSLRCVHCREPLKNKTKDHVFPRSWYPETTPENVQRWTVPSCRNCNGKYGEMEKELFIRLVLCVGPVKAEASGLSKTALASLGVGASGLSPTEKRHRLALKSRILRDIIPPDPGREYLPGFGAHAGFRADRQFGIKIPEQLLTAVAEKIIRGCEYVLCQKRIVEDPYALKIYFAEAAKIQDVLKIFDHFGPVHIGPGFQVRRAAAHDDPNLAMYKIDVWATLTIYATITD